MRLFLIMLLSICCVANGLYGAVKVDEDYWDKNSSVNGYPVNWSTIKVDSLQDPDLLHSLLTAAQDGNKALQEKNTGLQARVQAMEQERAVLQTEGSQKAGDLANRDRSIQSFLQGRTSLQEENAGLQARVQAVEQE